MLSAQVLDVVLLIALFSVIITAIHENSGPMGVAVFLRLFRGNTGADVPRSRSRVGPAQFYVRRVSGVVAPALSPSTTPSCARAEWAIASSSRVNLVKRWPRRDQNVEP